MSNYNKGTNYLNKGRPEKAVPLLKKQLTEQEFKECYLNLGNSYRLLDRNAEAEAAYKKANDVNIPSIDGKYGEYDLALSNLGLIEYMRDNDDAAISLYKRALTLNPMHFDAIWNHSNASLRKLCSRQPVDFNEAWKMYSYRFKRNNPVALDRALPLWDGISKIDKIVVLAEQGMGDKIMFGRFIKNLEEYCNEVWVQCPSELDVIFSEWKVCRSSAECLNGATEIPVVNGVPQVCGVPICSLAQLFCTGSDVLQSGTYFGNSSWLRGKFGFRKLDGEFKIGVVYTGSATHANNRNRSIPGGYFTRLYSFGTLYCLSPDSRRISGIINLNPSSWLETIEYINGLDLVITIDTSVAHMAGSLGVPCWVIQPLRETDFRWGSASMGEDNVWYPSVKMIRNPGSWEKVFDILAKKLAEERNPAMLLFASQMYAAGLASSIEDAKKTWKEIAINGSSALE